MARRSTGRWVERAGATGGGRTYRGQAPVRWYFSLVLIVLLGVALVAYSRYEDYHPASASQPKVGQSWYTALGFDVCGKLQPDLSPNPSTGKGATPQIRTQGDGIIRTQPLTAAYAGSNATFGRFLQGYPGLTVNTSRVKLPGQRAYSNGDKCPSGTPDAGKSGVVEVQVWSSFFGSGSTHPSRADDPAALKLGNGQIITVAFVPPGAAIPKPSGQTIATLANLFSGVSSTTTTVPSSVTTTTIAASTSTTVASTTSTSAVTTTTKP
jgi:hypothetical protein